MTHPEPITGGLELHGIGKSFGAVNVLRAIDLSIAPGEFVVFVGPSGCGKSTLLRLIAGLDAPTEGEIRIAGRDVTDADPSARGIAMVFQSYALYPHMTVAENMGFGLRMARRPAAEVRAKVEAAAETLRLAHLLDRRPGQLSGGQRQRVAIGRAIVRNPLIFLFDEPLSNLDAELRVEMRVEIARLHRSLGNTMIYVTHDQVEAMTLADKIVVLRSGRIEQVGTPAQLYEDPDNLFVAGFIGSPKMNALTGRWFADATVEIDGARLPAPELRSPPRDGAEVIVGIRPEHFVPARAGEPALQIRLEVAEFLGGTSWLYGNTLSGHRVVLAAARDTGFGAEGTLRATAAASDLCLFLPTGERLR